MRWLGQMQRAFELMCARANARYAHGSLLAEKGEIQRYVAESAADIQSLRLMTLDAARVIDEGRDARVQISLIKFHGARLLHDVIDRAIQVHGAAGVSDDFPLARLYSWHRAMRLFDGPDEVHMRTVARAEIGREKSAFAAAVTS
jgi:alkylation response protein AidB-like acyl-CoA dehydrogenase